MTNSDKPYKTGTDQKATKVIRVLLMQGGFMDNNLLFFSIQAASPHLIFPIPISHRTMDGYKTCWGLIPVKQNIPI